MYSYLRLCSPTIVTVFIRACIHTILPLLLLLRWRVHLLSVMTIHSLLCILMVLVANNAHVILCSHACEV